MSQMAASHVPMSSRLSSKTVPVLALNARRQGRQLNIGTLTADRWLRPTFDDPQRGHLGRLPQRSRTHVCKASSPSDKKASTSGAWKFEFSTASRIVTGTDAAGWLAPGA